MVAALKEGGCRRTPQRLAPPGILAGSRDHPGVEEIYRQVSAKFPATSLATFYKTAALPKGPGQAL